MPRSLTFGYNAALTLTELVVDRLLGASYDAREIPDTFFESFEFQMPLGARVEIQFHVLLPKPHISFGASPSNESRNATLHLDVIRGIVFAIGVYQEPFAASVDIELTLAIDPILQTIQPNFSNITAEDISVRPIDPESDPANPQPEPNPETARAIGSLLPNMLVDWLNSGGLLGFGIDLDLDSETEESTYQIMEADSVDFAIHTDPSEEDRDSFSLAFYNAALANETRGNPEGIPVFVESGKSFTLRISRAIFDNLIADFINQRFMRFTVTVGEEEQEPHGVRISAPNASNQVSIEGLPSDNHSNVYGRIKNATASPDRSITFETDEDGRFSKTLTAHIGDVLEVYGESIFDTSSGQAISLYTPDFRLADGHLDVQGEAFGYPGKIVEFDWGAEVSYSSNIYLRIDPVTGELLANVGASIDFPWWLDLVVLIVTTPIGYVFFLIKQDKIVANRIQEIFSEVNTNFLPGFNELDRMVLFLEELDVRRNGLILSGQIEAGRIRGAGRTDETSIVLDREERTNISPPSHEAIYCLGMGEVGEDESYCNTRVVTTSSVNQRFQIDLDDHAVTVWTIPTHAGSGVEDLGIVDFEQVDIDYLLSPSLRYIDRSLSIPPDASLEGRVFAVRSPWNSYAKVRINLQTDGTPILRWVTYQPSIEPRVEILGDWHKDFPQIPLFDGLIEPRGSDRYWGNFNLDVSGLYDELPLEIEWDYNGSANELTISRDRIRASLEIPTEHLEEDAFTRHLTVTITDAFGRTATTSRRFVGSKPYGSAKRLKDILRHPKEEMPYPPPDMFLNRTLLAIILALLEARIAVGPNESIETRFGAMRKGIK